MGSSKGDVGKVLTRHKLIVGLGQSHPDVLDAEHGTNALRTHKAAVGISVAKEWQAEHLLVPELRSQSP